MLPDGTRYVVGLWIEQTEGVEFWMKVTNDLKTRGVEDILIAVVDGLKASPRRLASFSGNDGADLHRAPDSRTTV